MGPSPLTSWASLPLPSISLLGLLPESGRYPGRKQRAESFLSWVLGGASEGSREVPRPPQSFGDDRSTFVAGILQDWAAGAVRLGTEERKEMCVCCSGHCPASTLLLVAEEQEERGRER